MDDVRKATVLLASLPDVDVAGLLQQLSHAQLELLATAAAELTEVDHQDQSEIAAELAANEPPGDRQRGQEPAAGVRPVPDASALDELARTPASVLAAALQGELPQTIAIAVASLPTQQAADVLARLSTDQQLRVVRCLASCQLAGTCQIDVLHGLADRARARRYPVLDARGGLSLVACLLVHVDRATEKALLENLSESDRPLVDPLLQRMAVLRSLRERRAA